MRESEEHDEDRTSGPPSEERVRLELVLFAELIERLEKEGRLAEALPFVLHRLGDLRRLLFDYEVRATQRLLPVEDPHERAARRLLEEMQERAKRLTEEWRDPEPSDEEED
jgi:hypothetical protein